jgi:tRNA(Arg) A34 adenosine deaminase TadA
MSFSIYSLTAEIFDKRGRLISSAKNNYNKTHPIQAKYASQVGISKAIYLHAEILAIIRCKHIKHAHKIVVKRFDKHGNPAIAKPCNICQAAISDSGIKIIEHT